MAAGSSPGRPLSPDTRVYFRKASIALIGMRGGSSPCFLGVSLTFTISLSWKIDPGQYHSTCIELGTT